MGIKTWKNSGFSPFSLLAFSAVLLLSLASTSANASPWQDALCNGQSSLTKYGDGVYWYRSFTGRMSSCDEFGYCTQLLSTPTGPYDGTNSCSSGTYAGEQVAFFGNIIEGYYGGALPSLNPVESTCSTSSGSIAFSSSDSTISYNGCTYTSAGLCMAMADGQTSCLFDPTGEASVSSFTPQNYDQYSNFLTLSESGSFSVSSPDDWDSVSGCVEHNSLNYCSSDVTPGTDYNFLYNSDLSGGTFSVFEFVPYVPPQTILTDSSTGITYSTPVSSSSSGGSGSGSGSGSGFIIGSNLSDFSSIDGTNTETSVGTSSSLSSGVVNIPSIDGSIPPSIGSESLLSSAQNSLQDALLRLESAPILDLPVPSISGSLAGCPVANIDLGEYGNFVIDSHCEIINSNSGMIRVMFIMIWSFAAVRLFLEA